MAAKKKQVPIKKLKKPQRGKASEWVDPQEGSEGAKSSDSEPISEEMHRADDRPEPPEIPAMQGRRIDAETGQDEDEMERLLREADAREIDELREKLRKGVPLKKSERKRIEDAEKARKSPPPRRGWLCDPKVIAEKLRAWWVNGEGTNYYVEEENEWKRVNQETLFLRMQEIGVPSFPVGDSDLSPAAQTLLYIQRKRMLDRCIEGVAGYKAGVHSIVTRKTLLLRGPHLLKPEPGEWTTIQELLDSRLVYEKHEDAFMRRQVEIFHGWMQRRLENVYLAGETILNGQVLCLCGGHGSAKSRIQHFIITPALGGRSADPQPYLFGDTDFNNEWMEAEHLCTEDPRPSGKLLDRVQFANKLKGLVVNDNHRWRGLYQGAMTVTPKFAVSMSFNDSPDEIRFFPPLGPNFRDKVLLFRVMKRPLPMPTKTPAERAAFKNQILRELPAYMHWLLHEFKLRPELQDQGQDRFGTKEYADPVLRSLLWDDSPAAEFLELIDESEMVVDTAHGGRDHRGSIFQGRRGMSAEKAAETYKFRVSCPASNLIAHAKSLNRRLWIGPAGELQEELRSQTSNRQIVARKLTDHNPVPRLLSQIAQDHPDRAAVHHFNNARLWFLMSKESDAVENAAGDAGF